MGYSKKKREEIINNLYNKAMSILKEIPKLVRTNHTILWNIKSTWPHLVCQVENFNIYINHKEFISLNVLYCMTKCEYKYENISIKELKQELSYLKQIEYVDNKHIRNITYII